MNKSTISWYDFRYCKKCKQESGHLITKTYYYGSKKTKIRVYCK
ncbi:unnamed protein product, partial [marine sediment metagenome]